MSKTIVYKAQETGLQVGRPFTWGGCIEWAIKTAGGGMYYLHNGLAVQTKEERILDSPTFKYANSIEVY